MRLTVEISRHTSGARVGILESRVIQGTHRGCDLLAGRQITRLMTAQVETMRKLENQYPGIPLEFDWAGMTTDDDERKAAAHMKISTPRDRYGWRSL